MYNMNSLNQTEYGNFNSLCDSSDTNRSNSVRC